MKSKTSGRRLRAIGVVAVLLFGSLPFFTRASGAEYPELSAWEHE